jgi:hypothetical protein
MATQNVNIGVNVSDNGTAKKVVQSFKEITNAAAEAQRAAGGIVSRPVKSTMAPGGTSGSRMVAATMAPSERMMSGEEYGRARGSAGATGASARDFANQAQGLGGLVRLYATYAANIFAVSAAFTALSNAMDTSNMVRGLDQLGAASGVALGSLSKELVRATDGAISLRDAMTATAKASSSGMDSEQILRMGKVAQQASQALGVDMADAISRISRGITKLEPELLDELGLFTKTGKAAEDYAKSVGKSVTELTDFERRAAFANAVLEEGEKKFSQINLDTNPYTKLLASIKDLAQVSLEFINKGLAPIVSYLSNSPTALGVAIAALGTVLVKQALPALGEFKAGLASTADKANQLSVQKAQDAAKARLAIDADILTRVEAMADDKVAAVDAAEQKIQALEASGLNKRSAAYKLLQKDITEVTKADIDAVEARAKLAEKSGDTKRATAYREVTSAVLEQKQAEEDLIVTKQNLSKQLEKDATGMTTYGMTVRAAERAQTAATRASIVSNAAYNGSLIGVTASMALMRAEMQAAGIATNTFAGRLLLARGALAAVGGMVSTVMAAFGPLMLIITAVSLAFSLLDGAFSKNNKESADLSGSLDKLDANAGHLAKTIDTINEKPFLERMSPESLKVKATALGEVSSAISSTINDLLKADKAASGWDKFLDGFKTLWGGDILSKSSKGLANGITESLASIAGSPEAKSLNKELSAILKIDTETATFQQVQDAIKKLGREAPQELKRLEDGFKKVSLASQVTAAKGTELVDAFKKLADLKQTIGNEFLPKDDVTKFGQELIATSQKLAIALDDPQQKLNAIIQLSANAVNIPGATLEQVAALNKAADLAKNIQTLEAKQLEIKQESVKKQQDLVDLVGEQRAALIEAGKPFRWANQTDEDAKKFKDITKDLRELKSAGEVTLKVKTELTSKLEGYSKEIEKATLSTYKAGADLVSKQISAEFIKAGKTVSDAYVSIIGETQATIKIKADSERAVVNAQIQQILSQRDLTIATRELSLQLQKKSLEDYLQSNPEGRQGVYDKLAVLEPQIQAVEAAKTGDFSKLKLSTDTKDLKKLNVEGDAFAQNMRASAAAVSNLRAQLKAIDIGEKDSALRESFAEPKKNLENQEKSVTLAKQELDVQSKLVTQGNLEFLAAKQSLDTTRLNLQQRIAVLAIDVEIARQSQLFKEGPTQDIKSAAKDKKEQLESDRKILITQQAQQRITLASSQVQDEMRALAFNAEEARKREAENAELALAKKSEELRIEQDLFGLYNSIGLLTETQKINQKFLLEQKSAELDYEQKISKLKTSNSQQMGQLDSREEDIWAQFAAGTGNLAALNAELDKIAETKALITSRTNEEASAAARVRDNTLGIASATKAAALDQERYNQLLTSAGDFANTLKQGFEGAAESSQKIAAALGDVATTMAQIAVNAEQRAKSEKLAQENVDKAWESMDYDKVIAAENAQAETKNKNAKQELADDAKLVNSSKKLFKEKTAAYKILNVMEKAMHVQRIALDLKEFALKMGLITKEQIAKAGAWVKELALKANNALVSIGIDIPAIYAKFMATMGPWGAAAAGAAIAAFVGGAFSKGGGGGFTPTAEQRQETQGTAMSWDSEGKKVQTSRGVFGDTDAKSESIANSLELIKDNAIEGLYYDNRAVTLLDSIDKSISGAARNLYGVQGLRSGSMFGTVEGKQSGGGLLGTGFLGSKTSRNITDSGLLIEGTFAQLASDTNAAVIDFFEQVTVTRKKWYGSSKSWIETKRTEIDSQTSEFFQDVFGNATKLFKVYAEKTGAITTQQVDQILGNLKIDNNKFVSLRGLKGEEFEAELSAIIGSVLDDASLAIFGSFEQYAQFGEGMLETVSRVIDTNDKVSVALTAMGSSFDLSGVVGTVLMEVRSTDDLFNKARSIFGLRTKTVFQEMDVAAANALREEYLAADRAKLADLESGRRDAIREDGIFSGSKLEQDFKDEKLALEASIKELSTPIVDTLKYDISEALVELAGGLEEFTSRSNFFIQNFLTESEQLGLYQETVAQTLRDLELPTNLTRDQYKALVQAQDLSTEAGRRAFDGLMKLAPAFDKVAKAAEEFADKAKSLQMRILELTGSAEEFLARQRAETLNEETDPYLRGLQNYIFALEDVEAAENALAKARQAEANKLKEQQKASESFIGSIKRYIDSLRKFKDSLLLGAASPLTPAEKYREAKQQFDAILATAMGTAVTPAEQSAKEAALGQLEGASNSFLEASRVYNASSQQYTDDFTLVQRALTQTASSLAEQLTSEEKSLAALNAQIGAMETVNESVLSVADAVNNLAAAVSAANLAREQIPTPTDPTAGGNAATQTNVSGSIEAIYQKYTGRGSDVAGKDYWMSGVLTGQRTLEQTETEIAKIIGGVPDFVESLYQKYFGRGSDAAGKAYWVEGLMSGTRDFAQTESEISRISNSIPTFVESLYKKYFNTVGDAEGKNFWVNAIKSGASTFEGVETSFAEIARNLPAFAVGTNFVPDDMLAQVHRGERIIPAADNAQLMQSLNSRDEANRVLVSEIRNLRSEVKQLREQQAKETGNIIVANFDAQQRAAEKIETAMNNTAQQSTWTAKVREGVKLK